MVFYFLLDCWISIHLPSYIITFQKTDNAHLVLMLLVSSSKTQKYTLLKISKLIRTSFITGSTDDLYIFCSIRLNRCYYKYYYIFIFFRWLSGKCWSKTFIWTILLGRAFTYGIFKFIFIISWKKSFLKYWLNKKICDKGNLEFFFGNYTRILI